MALGDTLRRIVASDNFILNAAGALVGIKNPNANGLDLRVDTPSAYLPYVLVQSGFPVILPSSGSSNATGQITHTTALPYQPSGTVQIFLPAGVVVGDATGGLYSAIYSSTTVCQLVGNPVTANSASTQLTSAVTLVTATVPGGAMGANGAMRATDVWSYPNNANVKTFSRRLGGVSIHNVSVTTTASAHLFVSTRNRANQALQVTNSAGISIFGSNGASPTYTSVDTSAPQTLLMQAQLAAATDYIILEGYTLEVLPSA